MARQTTDLILVPTSVLPVGATYPFVFPATSDGSPYWNDAKAYLVVTVTGKTSSPTVKPHLLAYDKASASFWEFWAATSAQSPTGAAQYAYSLVDNGFVPTPSGVIVQAAQMYMTPYMRLDLEIGGTGSVTLTAGFNRVNSPYSGI